MARASLVRVARGTAISHTAMKPNTASEPRTKIHHLDPSQHPSRFLPTISEDFVLESRIQMPLIRVNEKELGF